MYHWYSLFNSHRKSHGQASSQWGEEINFSHCNSVQWERERLYSFIRKAEKRVMLSILLTQVILTRRFVFLVSAFAEFCVGWLGLLGHGLAQRDLMTKGKLLSCLCPSLPAFVRFPQRPTWIQSYKHKWFIWEVVRGGVEVKGLNGACF